MHVFGLAVANAEAVFLLSLAVHVGAGVLCVAAGTVTCLARKRVGRHPRWGRVYLGGLCTVTGTAAVMAVLRWPADNHLLGIAVGAAGLASFGWLARRRSRPGWPVRHAIGMGGSFAALLTGFYVDNGPRLPVWDRLPHASYWLLPAAVGTVLTWWALRRFAAGVSARPRGAGRSGGRPVPPR